jgi:hypothetical protein
MAETACNVRHEAWGWQHSRCGTVQGTLRLVKTGRSDVSLVVFHRRAGSLSRRSASLLRRRRNRLCGNGAARGSGTPATPSTSDGATARQLWKPEYGPSRAERRSCDKPEKEAADCSLPAKEPSRADAQAAVVATRRRQNQGQETCDVGMPSIAGAMRSTQRVPPDLLRVWCAVKRQPHVRILVTVADVREEHVQARLIVPHLRRALRALNCLHIAAKVIVTRDVAAVVTYGR